MPLPSADNFRSPAALGRFLLTAAVGVSLDLWTKWIAFAKLAPNGLLTSPDGRVRVVDSPSQEYAFIPRWLHFRAMANQGAVFGIGQGQRAVFIAVSVLAIAFIFYLFSTSGRQKFYQFVLGLLLAGVLGNLYDRAALGYVRDMIYILPRRLLFHTGREVFPWIFNVADTLLCVGVVLIFLYSLFGGRGREARAEDQTPVVEDGDSGNPREAAAHG
jgi:signal peptidase II